MTNTSLILVLGLIMVHPSFSQEVNFENSKLINCGPRCVNFVNKWYKKESDLLSTIYSMSSKATEQGHSLKDVNDEIKANGLFTVVVKAKPNTLVSWDQPIIAHLEPTQNTDLGHYVVILPGDAEGGVKYWDGIKSVKRESIGSFLSKCSGYVIVVSRKEVSEKDLIVERVFPTYTLIAIAFAALGVVIVFQRKSKTV